MQQPKKNTYLQMAKRIKNSDHSKKLSENTTAFRIYTKRKINSTTNKHYEIKCHIHNLIVKSVILDNTTQEEMLIDVQFLFDYLTMFHSSLLPLLDIKTFYLCDKRSLSTDAKIMVIEFKQENFKYIISEDVIAEINFKRKCDADFYSQNIQNHLFSKLFEKDNLVLKREYVNIISNAQVNFLSCPFLFNRQINIKETSQFYSTYDPLNSPLIKCKSRIASNHLSDEKDIGDNEDDGILGLIKLCNELRIDESNLTRKFMHNTTASFFISTEGSIMLMGCKTIKETYAIMKHIFVLLYRTSVDIKTNQEMELKLSKRYYYHPDFSYQKESLNENEDEMSF
jgi:hypothetical protein